MPHNQSSQKINKSELSLGFGLVELLVSISIVVLVMGVIMARHSSYEGAVLLRSQAYQIALEAREIQLMAVSAEGQLGEYRNVFGLHFNTNNGANNHYHAFRDVDGDLFFDNDDTEKIGKRRNLDPRFKISEIRLMDGAVVVDDTKTHISIIFERPNFDARFSTDPSTLVSSNISTIEIDVCREGGSCDAMATVAEVRTIEISRTGQITVQ